jgi:probable HAF family extracellular repeat protein
LKGEIMWWIRLAAVATTTVASVAGAASPTIYPLGFSSGTTGSRGYGVNDSGQVAVSSIQLFGQGTANRYDGAAPGGTLRTLIPFAGYANAFSNAINASGQVAGHAQVSSVGTPIRAFRYDGTPGAGGVMRDLGTLGGANSDALGINDLGQVTGYAQADPAGPNPGQFAFVYTGTPGSGGVMKSLGALGTTGSSGSAINHNGQVAGSSGSSTDGAFHAFRYDGLPGTGVMHDLGLLPGFTQSGAAGINAGGQVVGNVSTATTAHAFIYKGTPGVDGAMTDLKTLPGGSISEADSINDAGFVVGFSDDASQLDFHPTLWRPDGSAVDLEAWLDAANPALGANWDLRNGFVGGISNSGFVTGDGIYLGPGALNNHGVAYILDASSLLPEPTGLILFSAAAQLLRRRR